MFEYHAFALGLIKHACVHTRQTVHQACVDEVNSPASLSALLGCMLPQGTSTPQYPSTSKSIHHSSYRECRTVQARNARTYLIDALCMFPRRCLQIIPHPNFNFISRRDNVALCVLDRSTSRSVGQLAPPGVCNSCLHGCITNVFCIHVYVCRGHLDCTTHE